MRSVKMSELRSLALSAAEKARALHWDLVPCPKDERDPVGIAFAMGTKLANEDAQLKAKLTAKGRKPWVKW